MKHSKTVEKVGFFTMYAFNQKYCMVEVVSPFKTSGSADGMQKHSWAGVTGIYFSAIYEKFEVQRGKSKIYLTNNYAQGLMHLGWSHMHMDDSKLRSMVAICPLHIISNLQTTYT